VRGFLISLAAIALLVPGLAVVAALWQNRLPWHEAPGPWARLTAYLGSNVARLDADSPFPELRPRAWPHPPRVVADALRIAVSSLGWLLVAEDGRSGRFEVVVTSRVFAFKDDLTLELSQTTDGGTVLTGVSRSRVGKGDLGTNTRHLLDLIEGIERRLPAASP
jgi:uncharacterized protein (DUF1499 family)